MNFLEFLAERVKNPEEKKTKSPTYKLLRKISFARNKNRLEQGRKRALETMTSEKTLRVRARKNARRYLALKLMGKRYDQMREVEREMFAKKIKANQALFNKTIDQYIIVLRKKAKDRLAKQKSPN